EDDLEEERGDHDRPAPARTPAVHRGHDREKQLAEEFEEAELHDLVLVVLEDIAVGETRVLFRTGVEIETERRLRARGERGHIKTRGTRHTDRRITHTRLNRQFHAARGEPATRLIGRED